MATKRNDDRKREEAERRLWLVRATALLSVMIFLLVALLMIGIPYLNANLMRNTGLASGDLASWQITALISMVGMLIGGVFIITAFRVDATAKNTASSEAREILERGQGDIEKRLGKGISEIKDAVRDGKSKVDKMVTKGESDIGEVVETGKSKIGEVVETGKSDIEDVVKTGNAAIGEVVRRGESDIGELVETGQSKIQDLISNGNSRIDGAIQEAGIKTTEAIDSESSRMRQATETSITRSETEFRRLMEQIQTDNQAVREFLDEHAPGLVREAFTAEQMEAIRSRAVEKLTEELLAEAIASTVRAMLEENPERLVDPVVERVTAMGRWRWLFRREDPPSGD